MSSTSRSRESSLVKILKIQQRKGNSEASINTKPTETRVLDTAHTSVNPTEDSTPSSNSLNTSDSTSDTDLPKLPAQKEIRLKPVFTRNKTPAPIRIHPPIENPRRNRHLLKASVIFVVIFAVLLYKAEKPAEIGLSAHKVDCSKFMDLQTSFPKQDRKLFKSVQTGVEGTFNEEPPEPSVFSLFSTDENLIESVMNELLKVTMKCINQTSYIDLKKEDLGDSLVSNYKNELMRRNIMIINNIDEARGEDVSSLHSFCDTHNPLVSKSVIFLTMKVPRSPPGKPVDYIYEYLNERWKNLADNIRGPLITRMIDQTFFLQP